MILQLIGCAIYMSIVFYTMGMINEENSENYNINFYSNTY